MPVFGRNNKRFGNKSRIILAGAAMVAGAISIPAGFASESLLAATPLSAHELNAAELNGLGPAASSPATPSPAAPRIEAAPIALDDDAQAGEASAQGPDPEIECMAKVVYHEAANQPRRGQLAVAQLIMNRVESGRFAATPCAVANQRGQFFQTASYEPPRQSTAWATALEVARQAHDGTADDVAQGAMFFHAVAQGTPRGWSNHVRVATIGGHAFYR